MCIHDVSGRHDHDVYVWFRFLLAPLSHFDWGTLSIGAAPGGTPSPTVPVKGKDSQVAIPSAETVCMRNEFMGEVDQASRCKAT